MDFGGSADPRTTPMPRNISFSMTTPQFLDGSKDVTRRMGWQTLKDGDVLQAVEKAMGLKKGESVKVLGLIKVRNVRREPLRRMIDDREYGTLECQREGFPQMTTKGFVEFFCDGHKGCIPGSIVTRIEFERITTIVGSAS
jgi:hypothetical protein